MIPCAVSVFSYFANKPRPSSIFKRIDICSQVDNEDINEIEIGRLKRKVKLLDTTAEREEICHEFSERCKQVLINDNVFTKCNLNFKFSKN